MDIFKRKYFKQRNITKDSLSKMQLESLEKITSENDILGVEAINRICIFIKNNVEDLYSTFNKHYELVNKRVNTKSQHSIKYIYGEEIGNKVYKNLLNNLVSGMYGTDNITKLYI